MQVGARNRSGPLWSESFGLDSKRAGLERDQYVSDVPRRNAGWSERLISTSGCASTCFGRAEKECRLELALVDQHDARAFVSNVPGRNAGWSQKKSGMQASMSVMAYANSKHRRRK